MLQRVSSTARLRPKLHIAVEKGDLKRVKKIINRRLKKCNIDEVDDVRVTNRINTSGGLRCSASLN
jgi:shikimate kinase